MREYKLRGINYKIRYNDFSGERTPIIFIHGLEKNIILGHSLGGPIAIELSDLLKNSVEALLLSESNLDPSSEGSASFEIANFNENDLDKTFEKKLTEYEKSGNTMWVATLRNWLPKAAFEISTNAVSGKTAKSILISCGARLVPFDIEELRNLMSEDEPDLDTLGDKKTALFVIISDTDDTFNFVVSIMYSQLFNLLCNKADDEYGGRLPIHVRCLLDEFENIGLISKFEKLIAFICSREISACIIL